MKESCKGKALKKRVLNHEKIGKKAAARRSQSTTEHRMDDFGRSVSSQ